MAATVVSASLKVSEWTKVKPAEFKGKELESALKSAEGVSGMKVGLPRAFPSVPKAKISEIESCITTLEADIITLQKALAELKKAQASLQAVENASNKTCSELQKMAKDKKASDDQVKKYQNASTIASAIGVEASNTLNAIK